MSTFISNFRDAVATVEMAYHAAIVHPVSAVHFGVFVKENEALAVAETPENAWHCAALIVSGGPLGHPDAAAAFVRARACIWAAPRPIQSDDVPPLCAFVIVDAKNDVIGTGSSVVSAWLDAAATCMNADLPSSAAAYVAPNNVFNLAAGR